MGYSFNNRTEADSNNFRNSLSIGRGQLSHCSQLIESVNFQATGDWRRRRRWWLLLSNKIPFKPCWSTHEEIQIKTTKKLYCGQAEWSVPMLLSSTVYNVGPGWIGGFREQPNKCMCWWNFRDHAVEYILSFPILRRRLLQQYIILPNIRQRERTQGGTQIHFNFLLNGIPASSIAFPVHLLFTWSVVCSKVAIIIIIYGYRLHFEVSSNGTMGNERSCVVYSVQVAVECFRYVAHMYCWWLLWWRGGGGSFVVAAIVCCVGDQESLNCKLW